MVCAKLWQRILYLKHFNNYKYIAKTQVGLQNTDFNDNITRKLDLNMEKINLKFDFDSSLTCYNLEHKSNNLKCRSLANKNIFSI